MPAGRHKKYSNVKYLTICLDDKDIEYLDDHRGKVARGEYLREIMYAIKSDIRIVSTIQENADLKRQLLETKKKLMFAETTNKKTNVEFNEAEAIKFYDELHLNDAIIKYGEKVNFDHLYNKYIERLTRIGFKDGKACSQWFMAHYRNSLQKAAI